MRRLLLILIIGAGMLFFLQPEAVLAGSCRCTITTNYGSAPNDCELQTAGVTDCVAQTAKSSASTQYSNCVYCSDNTCSATSCEDYGLTISDISCTNVDPCRQAVGSPNGQVKCISGKCYFDATALAAKDNQTGILGIGTQAKLSNPILEIKIPGLNFSEINKSVDSEGYIHLTSLSEYLAAVYKFAIAAASIVAAIMIVIGGFRITVSAGGEQKNVGKKNITQALIGLMILWSSYFLFYTINPELVQFKALKIYYIPQPPDEDEEDITGATATSEAGLSTVTGDNLRSNNGVRVDSATVLPALITAAASLKSQGILLYVADGYRSLEQQKALIEKNCQNAVGSTSCNPKPGRPQTCILKDNDPKNCPHTTGRAVDVWGKKDGVQCILQKNCTSNSASDPCRKDPCQAAVIKAMKDATFCSLSIEAWHFEKPKMSGSCN
ncbi:MAG: hypothetical protein AAB467_00510 [Patescibacteria group bacterium]